jgi:hypothetical protein
MEFLRALQVDPLPTHLLSHLNTRDAALWVMDPFVDQAGAADAAAAMTLPWRLVLCESWDPALLTALEAPEAPSDPLVRRRGFIQLVDTNPSQVLLPPHCLPVYLLNGRNSQVSVGLAALTRRLTMLDELRRMQVKELIVLAGNGPALPSELAELWDDGFRTLVTIVTDTPKAPVEVEKWRSERPFGTAVAYTSIAPAKFCRELVEAFLSGQAGDRVILRVRNVRGDIQPLDVTGLDDPEHPLLANYELLQADDLRGLQASDLTAAEIAAFFSDTAASWRPFAAGMPWERSNKPGQQLQTILRKLDKEGPEAGRIACISTESGAGGTTLMRTLAWNAAQEGYHRLPISHINC